MDRSPGVPVGELEFGGDGVDQVVFGAWLPVGGDFLVEGVDALGRGQHAGLAVAGGVGGDAVGEVVELEGLGGVEGDVGLENARGGEVLEVAVGEDALVLLLLLVQADDLAVVGEGVFWRMRPSMMRSRGML